MEKIRKNIIKVEDGLLNELKSLSVATVHEVMGKINAMDHEIKPIFKNENIVGHDLTVKTGAADNLMLIKAISMAQKGQIIVLDCADSIQAGPFGEVLEISKKIDEIESKIEEAVLSGMSLKEARKQSGYHHLQTKGEEIK